MIKPSVVDPGDEVTVLTKVFDTSLVVKGKTWLPLAQLIALPVLTWAAGKFYPQSSWKQRCKLAGIAMPVMLGSEWCHNLAHAAVANWVGKPVDAIRVVWGMPLLVYYDINDLTVTPRQHILRASGGPLFNLLQLPLTFLLRRFSRPNTLLRTAADSALISNAFLLTVGMLPIPGIDGGAILKWALVERGQTIKQADQTLRKVNGALCAGLAAGSVVAFKKKRRLSGGFLGMLAGMALGIALGLLKEQK